MENQPGWPTLHSTQDVHFCRMRSRRINYCTLRFIWCNEADKKKWRWSYPCTGLDRPTGVQEVQAPIISRQSAGEGGKVISPKQRQPLHPLHQERSLVLISVRGWVDLMAPVRPQGLSQRKIPMTPSGIEPATFRLKVQCLNQLHNRVPDNETDLHISCI